MANLGAKTADIAEIIYPIETPDIEMQDSNEFISGRENFMESKRKQRKRKQELCEHSAEPPSKMIKLDRSAQSLDGILHFDSRVRPQRRYLRNKSMVLTRIIWLLRNMIQPENIDRGRMTRNQRKAHWKAAHSDTDIRELCYDF